MLPAREPGVPANRWLYESLRAEILDGRLRPGARIPGTRDFAGQYGFSRGTIVSAFNHLKSEGYLEGSVGSGTYVSKILPEELLHAGRRQQQAAGHPPRNQRRHLSDYARRVSLFSSYEMRPSRAFRANIPALDLFPAALWAQVAGRRLRRVSTYDLMGCEPLGYPPLRRAVCDYLTASRGVKCAPEQIAIVSGAQEALDLAARLLLNPGDSVCMEDPGYTGAAIVFHAMGANIRSLELDGEGMVLPETDARKARLVYMTPGHQFPLGIAMSLPRRLAWLDWTRKSGALIFEDDYDSEFRYSGRPVPALQSLDPGGLVLFAGTFSKVLFPSLRIGYLVIPQDLVDIFAAAKSVTNRHAQLPDQAVLCDFITDGHFARHIRRMREVYAERLEVLLEASRDRLDGWLQISSIEAGLQTAGWLERGLNGEDVAKAAAAKKVEVTPLSRYSRRRALRQGLQLGFAAVDTREIRRGVRDLAAALEECRAYPLR